MQAPLIFLHLLNWFSWIDQLFEQYLPSPVYRFWNGVLSSLIDIARLSPGRFAARGLAACHRPAQMLVLYGYEPSGPSRKVRETLSALDLDYMMRPCPRDTLKEPGVSRNNRNRDLLMKEGGKIQLPFLLDPNTKQQLYESDQIVAYLWANYGNHAQPHWTYRVCHYTRWHQYSTVLCRLLRPRLDRNGAMKLESKLPEKPLELWGYESSSFARIARERLCALGLPYISHEVPMGASEKRKAFLKTHERELPDWRKRLGIIQVPYLYDPNTEKGMFESADICDYLSKEYQTAPANLQETWTDFRPAH